VHSDSRHLRVDACQAARHCGEPTVDGGLLLCRQLSPRASTAERYSLMRRLTVTEPDADTLDVCFDMTGKDGADRVVKAGSKRPKAARRLQQVSISPCAATELKASHLSSSLSMLCDNASRTKLRVP